MHKCISTRVSQGWQATSVNYCLYTWLFEHKCRAPASALATQQLQAKRSAIGILVTWKGGWVSIKGGNVVRQHGLSHTSAFCWKKTEVTHMLVLLAIRVN